MRNTGSVSDMFLAPDYMVELLLHEKKCPFCGRYWTDSSACGPNPVGSWKDQFANNRFQFGNRIKPPPTDHVCLRCHSLFTASGSAAYCGDTCRTLATRDINREAKRRQRERDAWDRSCAFCGDTFRTARPGQRFCSISHGNMARWATR